MKKISFDEFVKGYEEGYITEVVVFKDRVYGKDPRGCADKRCAYEVVYADLPTV